MAYKHIIISTEKNGRVLRVKINRPEVRNAFNEKLISEFLDVFSGAAAGKGAAYKNVRVVILEGEGAAFCGGGDLNWMKASLGLSKKENYEDCKHLTKMFHTMDRCPKPVVGIVHGYAIGGGVGLVSICDHVIAEAETVFSLSEVKLGLVPACIGPFVIGKIGVSQARSLFISGERFSSEKAKAIGLVHDMVSAAELQNRANEVTKRILEGGPHAISIAKNLIHELSHELLRKDFAKSLDFVAKELANLRVAAEGQEGVRAFLEKRTPKWRE